VAFGVKFSVLLDCFNLSAQRYKSLDDVQKFITLKPFIVSGSLNNRWKYEKLFYICYV
jgi:hypothetical protein